MEKEEVQDGNINLPQTEATPQSSTPDSKAPKQKSSIEPISPQPESVPVSNDPSVPIVERSYAGFITRFAAHAIDWQLLILIVIFFLLVFPSFAKSYPKELGISFIVTYITYRILLTKIYGKTIGKYILGVKIVGVKKEELTWLQTIIREPISLLISSAFIIGEFLYFFTRKKQALQDIIASSIVIQEKPLVKVRKILIFTVLIIIPIVYTVSILFIASKQFSELRDKNDLTEEINQKVLILYTSKGLCHALPSFQALEEKCTINIEGGCYLDTKTVEELKSLNSQIEIVITECVNYQYEVEKQQK